VAEVARDLVVVGVVSTPRPWRHALSSHVRDHVGGMQVRVLRDHSPALEEKLHVVVIDDVSTLLSPAWLARTRQAGVRILGVYDPTRVEGRGEESLLELGVDRTVAAEAPIEELVASIEALSADRPVDPVFAELAARALAPPSKPRVGTGTVTAVGGPAGAGSTELAVCLSARLAARGRRVVLVEANEARPDLACRLQLATTPNVVDALAASPDGTPLEAAFAPSLRGGRPPFDVVVGLVRTDQWHHLRGVDIDRCLERLRATHDDVVVDLGAHAEAPARGLPERWPATRSGLRSADRLVGVCPATGPAGLAKFLGWLADATGPGCHTGKRVLVAVNRVPRRHPTWRGDVETMLRDSVVEDRLAGLRWLPEDGRVADATRDTVPVRRGRWSQVVDGIAESVSGARGQGRWRK